MLTSRTLSSVLSCLGEREQPIAPIVFEGIELLFEELAGIVERVLPKTGLGRSELRLTRVVIQQWFTAGQHREEPFTDIGRLLCTDCAKRGDGEVVVPVRVEHPLREAAVVELGLQRPDRNEHAIGVVETARIALARGDSFPSREQRPFLLLQRHDRDDCATPRGIARLSERDDLASLICAEAEAARRTK